MNEFKQFAETKHEEWKSGAAGEVAAATGDADLTLPGDAVYGGSRHPISLMRNRIVQIFQRLGFAGRWSGGDDDWHNFTALNLPEDHPARDMQDTFYISTDPAWLLRTHTSNVQIREMEKANCPSVWSCPDECTAMKPSVHEATASFTRWKDCM